MAEARLTEKRVWSIRAMVGLYAGGRICQLYADQLPTLVIVILHVVTPALFALAHGSVLYSRKGILVFALLCLGFGRAARKSELAHWTSVSELLFHGCDGA
jgi:hypothetical protein